VHKKVNVFVSASLIAVTSFTSAIRVSYVEASGETGQSKLPSTTEDSISGSVEGIVGLDSREAVENMMGNSLKSTLLQYGPETPSSPSTTNATTIKQCSYPDAQIGPNPSTTIDTINISDSGMITHLKISDVIIYHTYLGDLEISIDHGNPNYNVRLKDQDVCGEYDDISATFDDNGVPITCNTSSPSISGVVQPEQTLSNFNEYDVNGSWNLQIDDGAYGDEGTLVQWCIEATISDTGQKPGVSTLYPISSPNNSSDYLVDWSTVNNADRYVLMERYNGGTWHQAYYGPDSYLNVTGKYDGEWCYQVISENSYGISEPSNTECTDVITVPPTLYSIDNSDWDRNFTVNWSSVSGAINYELQEQLNGGTWGSYYLAGTSKNLTGRVDGQWCYHVRAIYPEGSGGWSNTECANVDRTPPDYPNLISPIFDVVVHDSTPTFQWESSSDSVLFRIQVDNNGDGLNSPLIDTTVSTLKYTPSSPLPDGSYIWHVMARDAAGNWSFWSIARSFSIDTSVECVKPDSPQLNQPVDGFTLSDNQPFFDWSDVTNADEYWLWVMQQNDPNPPSGEHLEIVTQSEVTISDVLVDSDYQWYVYAHNKSNGCDVFSDPGETRTFTIDTTSDIIDMGFDPNHDGYWFKNFSGSITDFTLWEMRKMFGDEAVCVWYGPICQPRYEALKFLGEAIDTITGGLCDGFSVTSLRIFKGEDKPSEFQEGASKTHELDKQNVRKYLAYHQILQIVDPTKKANKISLDLESPNQVFSNIRAAISDGGSDPVILGICNFDNVPSEDRSCHSVVPYEISETSKGIFWVSVYESSDATTKYIEFDTNNNSWDYLTQNDYGGSTTGSISVVPLSVYLRDPICYWCTSKAKTLSSELADQIVILSQSRLLITNSQGQRLGYAGNQFVSEIPGAYANFPALGLNIPSKPVFTLPYGVNFSISLSGENAVGAQSLNQSEGLSITQFGPGYAVSVEDINETSSNNEIQISPDGTQVVYRAGSNVEATVKLDMGDSSIDREFQIQGADVGSGQELSVKVNVADNTLIVDNSKTSGGNFDLQITQLDSGGKYSFIHSDIHVDPADTQTIDYSSFDSTNTVTVAIDHDSNGTIDETITLDNETIRIFLPIVTKH
jgi:subtilisin-like proprotein convertase family protein